MGVLELLIERRCPQSVKATRAAAYSGHLEALQFLHDRGCPWDEEVSWQTALGSGDSDCKGGKHMEVLKYLLREQCPWDVRSVLLAAAAAGNVEMLQFLRDHNGGELWDQKLAGEMLFDAACWDHLEATKWLRTEANAPWPSQLWFGDGVKEYREDAAELSDDISMYDEEFTKDSEPLSQIEETESDSETELDLETESFSHAADADDAESRRMQCPWWDLEPLKWAVSEGCPLGEWPEEVLKVVQAVDPEVGDWVKQQLQQGEEPAKSNAGTEHKEEQDS
eukprot:TRINITY_DN1629_c0_g1_i1.p1 TRINITY_DN1629_c0_g1~~TRINITY_DN1629_c0_g1_i1.p1  ORF type:complete len:280 (+),score=57.39 TRINITY_DN1629_c0_g1_i1:1166-2005(+)